MNPTRPTLLIPLRPCLPIYFELHRDQVLLQYDGARKNIYSHYRYFANDNCLYLCFKSVTARYHLRKHRGSTSCGATSVLTQTPTFFQGYCNKKSVELLLNGNAFEFVHILHLQGAVVCFCCGVQVCCHCISTEMYKSIDISKEVYESMEQGLQWKGRSSVALNIFPPFSVQFATGPGESRRLRNAAVHEEHHTSRKRRQFVCLAQEEQHAPARYILQQEEVPC